MKTNEPNYLPGGGKSEHMSNVLDESLPTIIREAFWEYVEENDREPNIAVCEITFMDDGTSVEVKIQLSVDSNPETDDEIFFYCNGLESLVSMTEPGVEFTVTGFSYFDRYEFLYD